MPSMELQEAEMGQQWGYPGAGGSRAPGIRAGALASWPQPCRTRIQPDVKISKSPASPVYHCRNRDTTSVSKPRTATYSVEQGAKVALKTLLEKCGPELPPELPQDFRDIIENGEKFKFMSSIEKGNRVLFPCPLKQQDAVGAIKGLEALMASALAKLRLKKPSGAISVDMMKVACFISSAYITTVNGHHKGDEGVKKHLEDTDIHKAQSNSYRRLSAGMYSTKDGKYYHIHGSLNPFKIFEMLGLEEEPEDLEIIKDDYNKCIGIWERKVQEYTAKELEAMNEKHRQAGVEVLTRDEFLGKDHGKAMNVLPPFTVRASEHDKETPPIPAWEVSSEHGSPQVLQGVRVIELCRIIAGPTIGRSLAALGADVLKVTCEDLPDVPLFQVDGNTGKRCISLNLKKAKDGEIFKKYLREADVVIDGYRPGSIEKLGYGPKGLAELAKERRKGYVYVAEDCFGGTNVGGSGAEWSGRAGSQQIADCVTGVAWEQGLFMGKNEPVIPPFPMSDYGTGALGSAAALAGLYRRARDGGSWDCRTSLVQYDLFLLSLGLHTKEEQERLRAEHDGPFFNLKHHDSVDRVGQTALETINKVHGNPFEAEGLMEEEQCPGFNGATVKWPKEAVNIGDIHIGHARVSRPNGKDKVDEINRWDGWERDKSLLPGNDKDKNKHESTPAS